MLVLGACYSELLISLSGISPPRFLSRRADVCQRAPADRRCLFFHPFVFAPSASPKLFHFTAAATCGTSARGGGLSLVLCCACACSSLLAPSPLLRLLAWGRANSFLLRSPLRSGLAERRGSRCRCPSSSPCASSRLIPVLLPSFPSRIHRSLIACRERLR